MVGITPSRSGPPIGARAAAAASVSASSAPSAARARGRDLPPERR